MAELDGMADAGVGRLGYGHEGRGRNVGLTSPRRGASGSCGNRCAMGASMSSSMSVASRPICCAAMAAALGARGSMTTRPAATGRRRPSSRACASTGSRHRRCLMGRSTRPRFVPTSNRSWCPRSAQATSSCSTTWRSTSTRRFAPRSTGATRRFLPPYSPDFNPIEQAVAKLKAFLRAARPRRFDHVCEVIATAIGLFEPAECANYVRHSGHLVASLVRLTVSYTGRFCPGWCPHPWSR